MKAFTLLLFLLFIIVKPLRCQLPPENINNIIEVPAEQMAEAVNESGQTEIPEELMSLLAHPVDISSEQAAVLVRFQLLNAVQYHALRRHLARYGALAELEELQQVDYFDMVTIRSILPYITVREQMNAAASQQFLLRFQWNPNKRVQEYAGSAEKILFKYKANFRNHWNLSFTGEKDPGEKLLNSGRPAFDFNSASISYKGTRRVKKLIVGDFNAEYGQGLTLWSGLSFGGGPDVAGIYKAGRGIVPYTGTDENKFFRGVAGRIGFKRILVDCWISRHKIDANLVSDSTTRNNYITSFQNSGYHRSSSEISDYHTQRELAFGTAVIFTAAPITSGIVLSSQVFSVPVLPDVKPYALHSFSGTRNTNTGWFYSFSNRNFFFFGESSLDRDFSFATLQGVVASLDPRLSIAFLYRFYAVRYQALKSNARGVNTSNNNETGKYLGFNYKIFPQVTCSSSLDIYSFPFLKYRVDHPSAGWEWINQLEFNPTKKFTARLVWRNKLKQQNDSEGEDAIRELTDLHYRSWRLSVRYKIESSWEYGLRVETIEQHKSNVPAGMGTSLSQSIYFHPMGKRLSANARYALFNCPQFDARIYEYENDVTGAFSIPFYYGIGSRFYLNLDFKVNRTLNLSIRYAKSWFDNPDKEFPESSEIKLQVKAAFR
jgi:hypothetical protein